MFLPAWNTPACELYICFTSLSVRTLEYTLILVIFHMNKFIDDHINAVVCVVFPVECDNVSTETQFLYKVPVVQSYFIQTCCRASNVIKDVFVFADDSVVQSQTNQARSVHPFHVFQ